MTTERLHPDGEFDSAEDAAAFRRRLCPNCEGFGEYFEGEREAPTRCTDCEGSGEAPEPKCGRK